jgi:hypothetical protein
MSRWISAIVNTSRHSFAQPHRKNSQIPINRPILSAYALALLCSGVGKSPLPPAAAATCGTVSRIKAAARRILFFALRISSRISL